jgi:diguanylate cyclase (GGDEF)-like protein
LEVVAKVVAAQRMLARQSQWQTLATRDELTGLASRRRLFDDVDRALADGRQIGLAILDLDDFKALNDTFGHLTGDRILRDIGSLFLSRTRMNDLIARYGGDEFVLLVVDQPLEDVAAAADRLVAEIGTLQWTVSDILLHMAATSGVAHSSLLTDATVESLLDAADRDLYAKKWLKKHPDAPQELYEYPRHSASVVPIGAEKPPRAKRESEL